MDLNPVGMALSLAFNVALPTLWLMVLSRHVDWPPLTELCIGLFFPLSFGIGQAVIKRRFSPISAMALASILLTAAVGAFATNRFWFTVKGATVPFLVSLGLVVGRTRVTGIVAEILRKGPILAADALAPKLADPAVAARFHAILRTAVGWLALHFLFNGALNAFWNAMLISADPGTTAFNEQYGELLARNLYLVAAPCAVSLFTIVGVTLNRIRVLTGLTWKELFPA